jgi:hypothetical protein
MFTTANGLLEREMVPKKESRCQRSEKRFADATQSVDGSVTGYESSVKVGAVRCGVLQESSEGG